MAVWRVGPILTKGCVSTVLNGWFLVPAPKKDMLPEEETAAGLTSHRLIHLYVQPHVKSCSSTKKIFDLFKVATARFIKAMEKRLQGRGTRHSWLVTGTVIEVGFAAVVMIAAVAQPRSDRGQIITSADRTK